MALRVADLARGAAEDVVDAVAVEVADVGDREGALVARLAVEAGERGAGAAGVDPVVPSPPGAVAGLGDDRVRDAVAVDVLQRGDGPAEVVALGPVCCQRTFTGSLKPAPAAEEGTASASAAVRAVASLSMRPFYEPASASASMKLRSCEGGMPNAPRKRSLKCDGVQ